MLFLWKGKELFVEMKVPGYIYAIPATAIEIFVDKRGE